MDKISEDILIGYHYTSIENWAKIRKEGLRPYLIDRPAIREYVRDPVYGIWTWLYRLKGLSHIGSILFQMGTKGTMQVVQLRYRFNENDRLSPDNQPDKIIQLPHDGWIGILPYHTRKTEETAVIVTKTIPPEDIDLLDTFNLLDAWSGQ
jgi:hypothetical protein